MPKMRNRVAVSYFFNLFAINAIRLLKHAEMIPVVKQKILDLKIYIQSPK